MQTEETQSWVDKLSQDEAEECLTHLRGLASQLQGAMDAIVRRQLPSLQGSLHLQSAGCARLADLLHRSTQRALLSSKPAAAIADSDLAAEIRSATEALLTLNSSYSALLKHSGETLRLLAGLYRSYRGSVQLGPGMHGSLQTWSCEV